jgi:hypothetical protein
VGAQILPQQTRHVEYLTEIRVNGMNMFELRTFVLHLIDEQYKRC